jgi:hypothetical protein
METLVVRPAQPGDGADLARSWLDAARHYAELGPDVFQVPAADGLVEWFEELLGRPRSDDAVWLVAEVEGRVVGDVLARLEPPIEDAPRQLLRDLGGCGCGSTRSGGGGLPPSGVGSRLLRAVEEWGAGQRRGPVGADDVRGQSPLGAVLRAGHGLPATVDRVREAARLGRDRLQAAVVEWWRWWRRRLLDDLDRGVRVDQAAAGDDPAPAPGGQAAPEQQ